MISKDKLCASSAATVLCAALLAAGTGASAQTAGNNSAPVATADNGSQLQSVTVTARRISENEQKVPITVTAVTGQQLKTLNVQRINDLQFIDPSLRVSGTGVGGQNAVADFSI